MVASLSGAPDLPLLASHSKSLFVAAERVRARLVARTKVTATAKDQVLQNSLSRGVAWINTLGKLTEAGDFQAIAAATRGLMEIVVDMLLVHEDLGLDMKVCGQFYFLRKTDNGDPMYVSPFTSSADQTHRLFDAAESRRGVTLIVRIEIREPTEKKDFRGFVFFQKKKEKPKFWHWCFVVEQVLDGEISVRYGEPVAALEKMEIAPTLKSPAKMPRSRSTRVQAATE
jgi:hypothetical protein